MYLRHSNILKLIGDDIDIFFRIVKENKLIHLKINEYYIRIW